MILRREARYVSKNRNGFALELAGLFRLKPVTVCGQELKATPEF